MKNTVAFAIAAAVFVSFAGAASAQALKPEEMIKIRKSGYSFMAWNMGKIKANVDGEFNKDQVIAAANLIAATANSGMGALFAPGSEKDVAGEKTRVKPEFFEQPDKVKELAMKTSSRKQTNWPRSLRPATLPRSRRNSARPAGRAKPATTSFAISDRAGWRSACRYHSGVEEFVLTSGAGRSIHSPEAA